MGPLTLRQSLAAELPLTCLTALWAFGFIRPLYPLPRVGKFDA